MLRNLAAGVCGYLTFLIAPVVLFGITGRDPHTWPGARTVATATLVTLLTATLGGIVASRLARPPGNVRPALWLAGLLALAGLGSLLLHWGSGSVWSELVVLLVAVPGIVGAAYLGPPLAGNRGSPS